MYLLALPLLRLTQISFEYNIINDNDNDKKRKFNGNEPLGQMFIIF